MCRPALPIDPSSCCKSAASSTAEPFPTINDNALEVVAFVGNASGTGSYSSLDSGLLLNASSGADAGFANFPALDPAIVGDLNGSGTVDPGDAVQLNLAQLRRLGPGVCAALSRARRAIPSPAPIRL